MQDVLCCSKPIPTRMAVKTNTSPRITPATNRISVKCEATSKADELETNIRNNNGNMQQDFAAIKPTIVATTDVPCFALNPFEILLIS